MKINPTPDAVKGREIYLLRALCRELCAKTFQCSPPPPSVCFKKLVTLIKIINRAICGNSRKVRLILIDFHFYNKSLWNSPVPPYNNWKLVSILINYYASVFYCWNIENVKSTLLKISPEQVNCTFNFDAEIVSQHRKSLYPQEWARIDYVPQSISSPSEKTADKILQRSKLPGSDAP